MIYIYTLYLLRRCSWVLPLRPTPCRQLFGKSVHDRRPYVRGDDLHWPIDCHRHDWRRPHCGYVAVHLRPNAQLCHSRHTHAIALRLAVLGHSRWAVDCRRPHQCSSKCALWTGERWSKTEWCGILSQQKLLNAHSIFFTSSSTVKSWSCESNVLIFNVIIVIGATTFAGHCWFGLERNWNIIKLCTICFPLHRRDAHDVVYHVSKSIFSEWNFIVTYTHKANSELISSAKQQATQ